MNIFVSHPAIGTLEYVVRPTGLIVGRRGGGAHIELNWDSQASRRHAMIWSQGNAVWVQDLGSKNGCVLGDQVVRDPVRLDPGVVVMVGGTAVTLAAPMGAPAIAPTSSFPSLGAATPDPDLGPSTHDLPAGGAPARPVSNPVAPDRRLPRFVARDRVSLRVEKSKDLEELWTRDISHGGMFVVTDTPPERGTRTTVMLETPVGAVEIKAEVVHVVSTETARSTGATPGVGLEFIDLDKERRESIRQYIESVLAGGAIDETPIATMDLPRMDDGPKVERREPRRRGKTEVRAAAAPQKVEDRVTEVLERATIVVQRAEVEDYYAALEVPEDAPVYALRARVATLKAEITAVRGKASPPQGAKFDRALEILDRMGHVFADANRRLEYDFRTGHVRAAERLAQTNGDRTKVAELRRMWGASFPGTLERASSFAREAFSQRAKRDLHAAIRAGSAALELDPFHDELRRTVETWQQMTETSSP